MNMSLKLKRNLPIILFLILFLTFMTFAMGSQRIIAYTIEAGSEQLQQAVSLRLVSTDEIDPQKFIKWRPN
jgi:hypothetical protein